MRRIKFLFKPGWIVLALVVAAFAYLCFTILAPWQLGKNTTTSKRNDLIQKSIGAAPVAIETLLVGGKMDGSVEWRPVRLTGSYLPDPDLLERLQSNDGFPAFVVLHAFRLDSGPVIVVDRGYVKMTPGNHPPAIAPAPTGQVTVEGRLRMPESTTPGKNPVFEDNYWQVYAIDPAVIGRLDKTTAAPAYVQLAADQPGVLTPVELPQMDSGPYLSYGLQWLAFGIMAPLGLAYFIRAELRERRRSQPAEAMDGADSGSAPPTPEDKLADRYGKRG